MGKLNELISNIKEKFSKTKKIKKTKSASADIGQQSAKTSVWSSLLNRFKKNQTANSPKNISKKKSMSSGLALDDFYEKLFSYKLRPAIHSAFIYSFVAVTTFSLAKLGAIMIRPKPAPLFSNNINYEFKTANIAADMLVIKNRNLFNSFDGKVAEKKKKKKDDSLCLESNRKSAAPIELINTIVLQNENKSIAAMQLQTQKDIISLRRGDQIDRFGKIGNIERLKVIFRNSATGRCEYIAAKESPVDIKPTFNVLTPVQSKKVLAKAKDDKGIEAEGNKFKIKKSYLNEKLANIGDILTQAKATPVPNPDGTLRFKITDIQPGGVFSALGIQDQDFITRIDGKPIRSYNEVMSLFNSIKSVKELEITVERNGSEQNLEYSFNE